MKNLNDFISEEDKKKESVRPVKDSKRGTDDQKYVRLMEKYKRMRRGDKDKANKVLAEAFKLAKDGDVSKQAIMAGAYI